MTTTQPKLTNAVIHALSTIAYEEANQIDPEHTDIVLTEEHIYNDLVKSFLTKELDLSQLHRFDINL